MKRIVAFCLALFLITTINAKSIERNSNSASPFPGDAVSEITKEKDSERIQATGDNVFQDGGDRLVALQQNDGGWDWPLDDGDPNNASPLNTVGPIAMGLAQAYWYTNDASMYTALQNAGSLLLGKTNNFSPSDGYLALELDMVLGGTTYRDHVNANFYGPLAAGTYNRNGAGTLYNTNGYVNLIRTARANQGIPNLAAWDIGMGLVGAASCGADVSAWVAGTKAELDELDGNNYYDVIGLAGALYGLAFVGEEFDPTAGEHASASNLADLAAILASYQITNGGFAWNSNYVIPNAGNETIQETAYSILALAMVDRGTYSSNISGAAFYMVSTQLATGGWENYAGAGENNEITGEALWGIDISLEEVWVDDDWAGLADGTEVTTGSGGKAYIGFNAFDNIQDGIDAVSGSTVHVAAGTYVESILIDKSVTLLGATHGVCKKGYTVPSGYAWDPAVESIISHPNPAGGYKAIVDIDNVDDVIFDGFVVQELNAVGNKNTSLVRVRAHSKEISNIIVRNNVIGPNTNTTSQDGTHGRMGLYLVNHPYSDNGIVNSSFSCNKIFDCKGNGDNVFLWSSYYAYGAPGPASMDGTYIEDNEICGAHRSGIETAGGYSGLTIRNNDIHGNSGLPGDDPDKLKYGHGIQLIRGSSDKVSDPTTAYGPVDLTIEGNNIYNNEKNGIYMGPINNDYMIVNNNIYNNGWDGIMLDLLGQYWNPTFELPPTPGQYTVLDGSDNLVAKKNKISGNGRYGIRIVGTPSNGFIFKAEQNWWGDASGPEFDGENRIDYYQDNGPDIGEPIVDGGCGDKVNNWVDFCPYYTDIAMTTLQNIQVDMTAASCKFNGSSVSTVHDGDSDKDPRQSHFGLQNAVNCAYSGDIIEIVGGNQDPGNAMTNYKEVVVQDGIIVRGNGYIIDSGSPPIWSWTDEQMTFFECKLKLVNNDRWIRVHGGGDIILVDCEFWSRTVFTTWQYGPDAPYDNTVKGLNTDCDIINARILDAVRAPGPLDYPNNEPWTPPLGTGVVHFNNPNCAPNLDDLVLFLDPVGLHQLDGLPVSLWEDNTIVTDPTNSAHPEDATQSDPQRMPLMSRLYTSGGLMEFPAVKFSYNYGNTSYGLSDIMEIEYSKEITTNETSRWEPEASDKNLFVVFQVGDNPNEKVWVGDGEEGEWVPVDAPYYSDGRQCIFEAGGPLSGYNIYIAGGKLIFGMWNRFEQKFAMYDPTSSDNMYPLQPGNVYLAHLEYNGDTKQFRAVLNYADGSEARRGSTVLIPFQGLSRDMTNDVTKNDKSAVGGAARTRYHDYSTGETYSDHFGGKIADVMLYNNNFDADVTKMDEVYDFLNMRYLNFLPNGPFAYDNSNPRPKEGDWKIFSYSEYDMGSVQLSDAWPNPFAMTSSFSLNIPESQFVTVELFDNMGNKVLNLHDGMLTEGIHDFTINGTSLANGMYIFRVAGEGFAKSGKVVLSK